MKLRLWLCAILIFFSVDFALGQTVQRYAEFGDFTLESGEVIENCRIGYRTYGELNSDSSNAVLFPTWFGGRSGHLASLIGPDKVVDSTRFFVIAVDAFGNGVSSSPSNSGTQPDETFPEFTIRDMVTSQYILVTEHLQLSGLYAITGGSMGGMQTFQWIVQYPVFMEQAVPWVGSPRLTSSDLLLWNMELQVIEAAHKGNADLSAMMRLIGSLQNLAIRTPEYLTEHTTREEFPEYYERIQSGIAKNHDSYNWASQLRAMITHDVTKPFQGSLKIASNEVRTDLLIVVELQDHMVNPTPALEFADHVNAETLILDNPCGHLIMECERDRVGTRITGFLKP